MGIALNLTKSFDFFLKESKIIKIKMSKLKAQFSGHHWASWGREEGLKAFLDAQLFGFAAAWSQIG